MQINIIEQKKNRMVFEIEGLDHTVSNLLVDELWLDKEIESAAYNIEHPLVGIPKFIVETAKKDPKAVVSDAIARLKAKNKAFVKSASAL